MSSDTQPFFGLDRFADNAPMFHGIDGALCSALTRATGPTVTPPCPPASPGLEDEKTAPHPAHASGPDTTDRARHNTTGSDSHRS